MWPKIPIFGIAREEGAFYIASLPSTDIGMSGHKRRSAAEPGLTPPARSHILATSGKSRPATPVEDDGPL
jgi:hypothetical protein